MNYMDSFKKTTFFTIDYSDLESLIERIYGTKFDFVLDQECDNSYCISFYAESRYSKNELEIDDMESFINGNSQTTNLSYLLFNELCGREYIEEGNYLVEVCW